MNLYDTTKITTERVEKVEKILVKSILLINSRLLSSFVAYRDYPQSPDQPLIAYLEVFFQHHLHINFNLLHLSFDSFQATLSCAKESLPKNRLSPLLPSKHFVSGNLISDSSEFLSVSFVSKSHSFPNQVICLLSVVKQFVRNLQLCLCSCCFRPTSFLQFLKFFISSKKPFQIFSVDIRSGPCNASSFQTSGGNTVYDYSLTVDLIC